jgi:hypothetical protein
VNPSAIKGTVARIWEGIFLSIADNISVFHNSDARFPPYFFRTLLILALPILFLVGANPSSPALQLLGVAAVMLTILSIPLTTYLSLKNKEYTLEGRTLREVETFLGRNEKEIDLGKTEEIYVRKGIIGKVLGVGKICIVSDGGIFIIDYMDNPEEVSQDLQGLSQ